jgi:molecular chaperone DnaK (HSP70)
VFAMDAAIRGGVLVLHGDVKANNIFLLDMTPMSLLGSLRPCDGICCFTHLIACNFHTSYHKKSQLVLSTAAADGQTHDLNFELFWAFEM